MSEPEFSTDYTDEITCPHCGYEFGDSWEARDHGEEACAQCGGKFEYTRNVEITYSTEKK